MQKMFYEIFDAVEKAPDTLSRVKILQENKSDALIQFLQGVYNPTVKFVVTEIPEYKPVEVPPGMGYTSMEMEMRNAYIYQEGHPRRPPTLPLKRTNELLIQVLEALEPREAKLFSNMLLKRLDVPCMSRALAETAFPGKI